MVYKNSSNKILLNRNKIIVVFLILIYISGIFSGCAFAFKNAENLIFVQKVLDIEKIIKSLNSGNLTSLLKYIFRDFALLCAIIILKYSGVLKGIVISIPFAYAVQNTCIYICAIFNKTTTFFNLIFSYLLKDIAVGMIIIVYTYSIIIEILNDRYNLKKDSIRLIIHTVAVTFIYVVDFSVKALF